LPSPFKPLPNFLPTKLPDIIPLARGHSAPVLDTAWSPFDDSLVASGGDDGNILIWKVEASVFDGWGGEHWVPEDFSPVARISASPKKVGQLQFHPVAQHVLASATGEHTVKLWDLERSDDPRLVLTGHGDTIQSIDWNYTGTLLVTTARDRKLRLFDPRAGSEAVRVAEGHAGIKSSRAVWLGDTDRIATTGFSRTSERELSLWDGGSLDNMRKLIVDQSAGIVMPFWSDNNILFLAGKGDGNIRYYEYETDTLHALSEHKSTEPQRGLCFLPRRALSVSDCEIARGYKLMNTVIEPIAFVVPRKSDSFQADIFPDAPSAEPALSAAEYFSGRSAAPIMINLDTGALTSGSAPRPAPTKTYSAPAPEPSPVPTPKSTMSAPAPTPAPAPSPKASLPVPQREDSASLTASPTSLRASSVLNTPKSTATNDLVVQEENSRLGQELRDARAQIRNLELQVEALKANAQRAKAVLEDL